MNVDLVIAVCRSSATDQCKYLRFPVFLPVSFDDGVIAQTGTVVDISRDGCRIRIAVALHGKQYVQIENKLGNKNNELDYQNRELAQGQQSRTGSLRFSPETENGTTR